MLLHYLHLKVAHTLPHLGIENSTQVGMEI